MCLTPWAPPLNWLQSLFSLPSDIRQSDTLGTFESIKFKTHLFALNVNKLLILFLVPVTILPPEAWLSLKESVKPSTHHPAVFPADETLDSLFCGVWALPLSVLLMTPSIIWTIYNLPHCNFTMLVCIGHTISTAYNSKEGCFWIKGLRNRTCHIQYRLLSP